MKINPHDRLILLLVAVMVGFFVAVFVPNLAPSIIAWFVDKDGFKSWASIIGTVAGLFTSIWIMNRNHAVADRKATTDERSKEVVECSKAIMTLARSREEAIRLLESMAAARRAGEFILLETAALRDGPAVNPDSLAFLVRRKSSNLLQILSRAGVDAERIFTLRNWHSEQLEKVTAQLLDAFRDRPPTQEETRALLGERRVNEINVFLHRLERDLVQQVELLNHWLPWMRDRVRELYPEAEVDIDMALGPSPGTV